MIGVTTFFGVQPHQWRTAVDAGDDLEKGRLEEFRGTVNAFVRAYDFLSQIIDYGDTRVEKWAIFLRVYRRTIERDTDDGPAIVTDDIVLTHYRLRRQEQRELKLADGDAGGLTGMTDAGSGQPHEPKYGPLQAVIDQINQLFIGTGVGEIDQVSTVETVARHLVENQRLQSEAMANTPVDFASSPTIETELEDVVYAAAAGNGSAFKALLQLDSLKPLVPILLAAGIYEKLRDEAARAAV